MAVAIEMQQSGHARFVLHPLGEGFAATGDDDIDRIRHGEHMGNSLAVRRRHQLRGGGGQARCGEARMDSGQNGPRGMKTLRPAAQNYRVSGFERNRRCIRRHVRARFIDNADHPKRHGDFLDVEAVMRHIPRRKHTADGIG